jgi:DNA-binding XRE family transcriptional regulator
VTIRVPDPAWHRQFLNATDTLGEAHMPTKELYDPLEAGPSDIGQKALIMAIEIVRERIARLPRSDKEDLFELVVALLSDDPEEAESAACTMHEILKKPGSSRVRPMDVPSDPNEHREGLTKWIAFISRRISEERTKAGLTQEELAQSAGLPQSHISRLETGKHSPSHATIEKIAAALGRPVSEFDPSA